MAEEIYTIDNSLRRIDFPNNFVFGVYNDKNVLSLTFQMPRYYGEIDLSEFSIQINYMNALGQGDVYYVPSPTVAEETITFNWILGRSVFAQKGTVKFVVCLRQTTLDGAILKEFNTTISSGEVLEGLEVENDEDGEALNILSQMRSMFASVEVYASEVRDYVEDYTEKLDLFLGNVEADMEATQAYSSGDYIYVQGHLYKATDSIAVGDSLIEETNVTVTTLLSELKALAS